MAHSSEKGLMRILRYLWLGFDRRSLAFKLVSTLSIGFIAAVGAGALVFEQFSRKAIAETAVAEAFYKIKLVRSVLLEQVIARDPQDRAFPKLIREIAVEQRLEQISIAAPEGNIIYSTDEKMLGRRMPLQTLASDQILRDGTLVRFEGGKKARHVRMIQKVVVGGEPFGDIEILVSLDPVYRRFAMNRLFFFAAALLIVSAGALLIQWLVHRIVRRPIQKLITVVEKARQGELGVRSYVREDPNLRQLAIRFQAMALGIDRAKKEIEAQHQRDLARANRLASLGQYISNISHEIRNPLAAIQAALHALRGEFRGEEGSRIYAEVQSKIGRIEQTVNNLLRYARQAPPSFQPCDVADPVLEALQYARHRLLQQKIEVEWDVPHDLPAVNADEAMLQQVFLNLFLNAAAAMPDGGRLSIRACAREHPQQGDAGILTVISDTGTGILPEDMEKIFEPFFSKRRGGTGLGLSVARGIIESHGGTIRAESTPGAGSSFLIFLPFTPGRSLRPQAPETPVAQGLRP